MFFALHLLQLCCILSGIALKVSANEQKRETFVEERINRKEMELSNYEVLSIFYNSTNGPSWNTNGGWMAGSSPCDDSWY